MIDAHLSPGGNSRGRRANSHLANFAPEPKGLRENVRVLAVEAVVRARSNFENGCACSTSSAP